MDKVKFFVGFYGVLAVVSALGMIILFFTAGLIGLVYGIIGVILFASIMRAFEVLGDIADNSAKALKIAREAADGSGSSAAPAPMRENRPPVISTPQGEKWTCTKCGQSNSAQQIQCKGCAEYR
jgi:predicted lipid-binding transport protein (Tim44 family)